jgi:4-amino-4-deoxy-L-arabinose transferase-like glycosyltransferase
MTSQKYIFLLSILIGVKITAIFYTSFDLFGDEAQYWIWSQDLDFGYYSKPPLLSWIIGFVVFLIGDSFEAIKLISLFSYFLTSYVIYLLVFEIYEKKELSIIAGFSFYIIPASSVSSFLLSTDVILILFWSLSLLTLLKLRKNPKFINFLLLGIFLGLALLTKYAASYFYLSLILIYFFDKKLKKIFFNNILKSIVFFLSTCLVVLPNMLWNLNNNWITFSHTSDNAGLNRLDINFFQGLEFIITQGLMVGPILFFFFIINFKKLAFNFETKFLLSFSLPIFAIVLLESILVRANANWAAVGLIAFFILILNHAFLLSKKIITINNIINYVFSLVFFILIGTSSSLKIFKRIDGITVFANLLDKKYLNDGFYLVIQDRLLFSNLKFIYRDSKKVLFTPHAPGSKIKSHFQLSNPLPKSFKKNFIYIGDKSNLKYIGGKKEILTIGSIKTSFKKSPIIIYEVIF